MGNGKIVYTPLAFRTISLDGAHYLTNGDAVFNVGSGNFGIDALISLNAPNTVLNMICHKVSADWDVNQGFGYVFFVDPTDRTLQFEFNDDNTTLVVASPTNSIPASGWFWVKLNVNRSGNVDLYVDGVLVKSTDISARSGSSLDNTGLFTVGQSFDGAMSLLRFDQGRTLSSAWITREAARLLYGYPREVQDFTALWTFPDSLYDLSDSAHLLTYSSGSPTYAAGWPTADTSYTFAINYSYGHRPGWLPADDQQRALDGTLIIYNGPRKRKITLDFLCDVAQVAVFDCIYAACRPFDFYEDADLPKTFTAVLEDPPDVRSKTWSRFDVSLSLVEV
jgi:hypothetical protein